MSFFQFGRKIEFTKEYSLAEIPLFASLTPSEQKLIEKKARLVEFKRGDIVYEEGTPSEAFYVVISGRFRLFLKPRPGGAEKTVFFFYRGDHFGEASLLTGRKHSATVEAKRDGVILRIDRDDFLKLIKDIPNVSHQLNRSMGVRLGKIESTSRVEVKTAALYSNGDSPAALRFWMDMAASLHEETRKKVLIVDFSPAVSAGIQEIFQTSNIPGFDLDKLDPSSENDVKASFLKHPRGFVYLRVVSSEENGRDEKRLAMLLTLLTYRYDYLLLRMPAAMNHFSFSAIKHSDVVYIFTGARASDMPATAGAVKEFTRHFGFTQAEMRVLVLDDHERSPEFFEKKEAVLGARIFSFVPDPEKQLERYQSTVKFLSKEFSGRLLGLALGSGAAYGLAHIGILKVLEKEGIFPDIVVGSSIGALVAGFWGAGFTSEELEKVAYGIDKKTGFFKLLGFRDMSIAHRGFFKGNQVLKFFESYLGNKTFQDLKVPIKIVAANLFTSEEVVMDTGSVAEAIRASISIPGIFRPFPWRGKQLIDGGVVDPLPVRLLQSLGVKKIIAVNVLLGPKDRIERNHMQAEEHRRKAEAANAAGILQRSLNSGIDKVRNRYAVNIFNVIMNTIQFLEYEIAESSGSLADVMIHAIVKEAHWAEFYSPEKFIKIGEEKAREHLPEIRKLLEE